MAQFKIHQSGGFTAVDNTMLRNKDISLKAKGLLCVMLSLPPEWNYSVNGLVAICRENLTAINTALHELKQFGYLTVTKILPGQSESGRIEYQYDVYAVAEENPNFQGIEKQGIQKQGIEILPLENPHQYNKDKVIDELKILDIQRIETVE